MSGGIVRVAAGVVLREDGQVLLAQRPPGKAYAGYWEFPGGKIELGESPRAALARELAEELGISVRHAVPWLIRRFVYPHAQVELNFFRVLAWDGEPIGHDGQAFQWQTPDRLTVKPMVPANAPILRALSLPSIYGITMASDLGEEIFLARAELAFAHGLRLLQLREKEWPRERQRLFAANLKRRAAAFGAKLLLNGSAADAIAWGCDGVHWTAANLMAATARPNLPAGMLCAASCHNRAELQQAMALDLDFAVLGSVLATPTHPGVVPLGWDEWASIAAATTLPVYALGGLVCADLGTAMSRGAHGIALRRGAWPARPLA